MIEILFKAGKTNFTLQGIYDILVNEITIVTISSSIYIQFADNFHDILEKSPVT